jgi:hypothetical protein
MIPFAHHTVTVLNPSETTDAGNTKIRDWSNPVSTVLVGCHVQPVAGNVTSNTENPDPISPEVETKLMLFAPSNEVLTSQSRVVWLGNTFEVRGEPEEYPDPLTGDVHHQEVTLVRTSG